MKTNNMSEKPLVSVLLCTHNAESYISNTLDSVLDQTYDNMEILLRDDASEDTTVSVLNKYSEIDNRITIFESKNNIGPYEGLNKLLKEAEGEYIAIQDHDDIWHPKKIEWQIEFLETNSGFVACGGLPVKYWEEDDKIYFIDVDQVGNFAPHPSLVFRNKGYEYNSNVKYKTDMYFMENILCKNNGKIFNLQKPVYISMVREDGGNLASSWTKMRHVIHYGIKSRKLEYIPLALLWNLFPTRFIDNETDKLYEQSDRQCVSVLKEDSRTAPLYQYLLNYINN